MPERRVHRKKPAPWAATCPICHKDLPNGNKIINAEGTMMHLKCYRTKMKKGK